jgi:DNA-binding transcriptional regulator GbsR (MarR family)
VPPTESRPEPDLNQARSLGIETCGRIAAFWGFTRTMGRAYGLLYLSPEPLSQPEVQRRLGISAGSASMTLASLIKWKVVHKVKPRGQRRDLYQAETDFWKMISGVLNTRERQEIAAGVASVDRACSFARSARRGAKGNARRDAAFALARLQRLQEICRLGETMLEMLLGELALDVGQFRHVFRADRPTAD